MEEKALACLLVVAKSSPSKKVAVLLLRDVRSTTRRLDLTSKPPLLNQTLLGREPNGKRVFVLVHVVGRENAEKPQDVDGNVNGI